MSWEPWMRAQEEVDPDDPGLLRNILTKDMTEEDHRQARQWVMSLITEPDREGEDRGRKEAEMDL